jgi:hypothetical protein
MPSLYDVPTDVIQFVIFPYLDNKSRFIANDVLHPSRQIEYRFPSRIQKDDIIRHATCIACTILDPLINTSNTFTIQNLIYLLLKILNGHADILLQYNPEFRRVAREKVREYSDIHNSGYYTVSKGFKKGAVNLCKLILERLHKVPYIRYVCGSSVYSVKN